MPKRIRLALQLTLERTLALILSLLPAPASGTGRRRRVPRAVPPPPRTLSGRRLLVRRTALLLPLPRPRTAPTGDPLLDDPGPLVRPYLLAHERRRRQQERRAALALALAGVDVGPWVIHGHHVGTPVTGAAA
ncbi:hypothetical protein ACFOOM_16070 [Streptomyces echinoruber]|uniref:Uncharacterized protein n=1 Tax=Streptomyces echinoruber TaxID=68898 RepID=A0A918V8B5_9ACTN|nr:hypothetical protein [Streptomyces echinoruber]GGZ81047.1 hypothetical protein GCM10010389_18370 [Streptomyces echinoruber]